MAVSACHLAAVTQLAGAVPSRRTAGGVGNARAEGLGVGWQSCGSGWGSGKASAGGRGPCEGTAGVTQAKPEVCGWSCLGPGLGRGCSKPQQNHLRACVHLVAFSGALPSCSHPSTPISHSQHRQDTRALPALPTPLTTHVHGSQCSIQPRTHHPIHTSPPRPRWDRSLLTAAHNHHTGLAETPRSRCQPSCQPHRPARPTRRPLHEATRNISSASPASMRRVKPSAT